MNKFREFGFILKEVTRLYTRRYEERARALGLTLPQCKVLVYLARNEGVSQAQLSELTEVEPMSLVRILDHMEEEGLLERRASPLDRRARSLFLRAKAKPLEDFIWTISDISRAASRSIHRGAHRWTPEARSQRAQPQAPDAARSEILMAAVEQSVTAPGSKLRRLRFGLMVVVPSVVIIAGLCIYFLGGRYENTDDAYTQAAAVSVSSNISGRVVEIDVHDNQFVKQGATLFRLDDRPLRISVSEAAARLASAKLKVVSLKSTYRQRQADLRAAEESMAYEQSEYARHERLLKSGIVSRAQYDQASHALDTARQQVAGARQQLAAIAAELAENPDIDPDRHPDVQEAQAALDRANLNLSYTVILAPSDGVVTKVEMLQVGDYINAAAPLFSLVSNQDNFKEAQLAGMRVGQSASIKIDRYPDKHFNAVVASMSPSTGSQFSMLPPENASGNWVKVVQRIPVRLHLANADPSIFLQAGLSANVSVDTRSSADSRTVSDHPALMGATSR